MMLNNYDFNHTENNNEMENETNTYQPLTPSGSHNNNKKNPVYRTLRLRWGVLGDIYPSAAV